MLLAGEFLSTLECCRVAGLEKKILWPKVEKRGALKGDLGTTVNHLVNAFFLLHLPPCNTKLEREKKTKYRAWIDIWMVFKWEI